MAAVEQTGSIYCVQTNCLGYGRFTEREPTNVPVQVAKIIAAMKDIDQKDWQEQESIRLGAKKQFISLMTKGLFPTQFRVAVVNKNFLSRVINLIVRIFAFLFCRTKNYFLMKNPLNKNEILRINKRENSEDAVIAMRKLPQIVEFVELLKEFMPDLLESMPDQKGCLAQIQGNTKFTEKEKVILKAAAVAQYTFFEQLAKGHTREDRPAGKAQTQADGIAALEQFLPHYRAAFEVDFAQYPSGFKEVTETRYSPDCDPSLQTMVVK